MSGSRISPIGGIVRGAVAGAVGTLAMDLVWYYRYRKGGGEDGFFDWEFATSTEDYDSASAPAKVGQRLVEGMFDTKLKPETAGFMTNFVHWATGVGYGVGYGIVAGSVAKPKVSYGLALGPAAWTNSYAMLAPMGLYKPMWEYDAKTLGKDLSAHVVYGLAAAFTYRLLSVGAVEDGVLAE